VLVAGCGRLGLAAARLFAAGGAQVYGLRRSCPSEVNRDEPVRFIQADLLDPETLRALPTVDLVICAQAPSRPTDNPALTYVVGTQNLMQALAHHPPKRVIHVSSTGVYLDSGGAVVDETTPAGPVAAAPIGDRPRIEALIQAERAALSGPAPAIILRLAGLYDGSKQVLSRYAKKRPPAGQIMNRIHVEDAASALRVLAECGGPGEVYIGVDDEPVETSVFFDWMAKRGFWALESRVISPVKLSGKKLSNEKLKKLGWLPRFLTFREGYGFGESSGPQASVPAPSPTPAPDSK